MLWPAIENIYKSAEKAIKKELLRDPALELMVVIMKVSPNDSFNDKAIKLGKLYQLLTLSILNNLKNSYGSHLK
jgi:hypothetical protein